MEATEAGADGVVPEQNPATSSFGTTPPARPFWNLMASQAPLLTQEGNFKTRPANSFTPSMTAATIGPLSAPLRLYDRRYGALCLAGTRCGVDRRAGGSGGLRHSPDFTRICEYPPGRFPQNHRMLAEPKHETADSLVHGHRADRLCRRDVRYCVRLRPADRAASRCPVWCREAGLQRLPGPIEPVSYRPADHGASLRRRSEGDGSERGIRPFAINRLHCVDCVPWFVPFDAASIVYGGVLRLVQTGGARASG